MILLDSTVKIERVKEILAYIAVCIFWGSTYLAIRIGVGELPPMFFAGIRFFFAGSLVLIFAWIKGLQFPKTFIEVRKISTVGILLLFLCNGSMVWAEQEVSSSIASILAAIVPLFMALIEFIIWGKKIKIKGLVGLLLGFVGVIVLIVSPSNMEKSNLAYIMLVLFATFMWSVGSIYSQSVKTSANTITAIGIQMLSASFLLLFTSLAIGEFSKIHIGFKGIASTIYLIIFGSLIGYSCYIYILKKWPAEKAGTYAYINPMVAVLLGALVLNEPITTKTIISILIILGGVFLVQTSKSSSKIFELDENIENETDLKLNELDTM
jgi:drug/metabolite transporter (DMT)-like permease